MRAIILARVSTEMQEDGFSLDAQLDRLRNYCSIKELDVVKEFTFVESSFKGKRTKFYETINFVKQSKGKIAIVVDTVDRLQRSFKEFPMLIDLIERDKIELHFYKENLIVDKNYKSSDLAMWQMQIMSANMYVNSTRDNVKRSEEKMLKEGLLPGKAPLGYLNVIDNGKKNIVIDSERGYLVCKLFEQYSTGLYSMDELVKQSIKWGLSNKKSGHPITKAQLSKILQNPFYYGVMKYNNVFYPHVYEPLISKKLFDVCEQVRTGKYKRTSKHTKMPFIFRGLVRCKHCGCLYSPEIKKEKYIYLRPSPLKKCPHCKNVNEDILLQSVEACFSSIAFDAEMKEVLAKELKSAYEKKHGNTECLLNKNRRELSDIEIKRSHLLDLLMENTVSAEAYKVKDKELELRKIELQQNIEILEQPNVCLDEAIDKVLNFGENSFGIFKSSKTEEKRKILNIVFSNFQLDGKNVEISMRKHFELLSKIGVCQDWCPEEDSNFHEKTLIST